MAAQESPCIHLTFRRRRVLLRTPQLQISRSVRQMRTNLSDLPNDRAKLAHRRESHRVLAHQNRTPALLEKATTTAGQLMSELMQERRGLAAKGQQETRKAQLKRC